jgi:DNA-binding HxlR family transcriptional regulator
MSRKKKIYECSVEATLSVIGGKWKAIILFHLMKKDVIRFGEFKRIMPNITQQMLTSQLRELEEDGVVNRKVYPQVPPKVEYSLSSYGQTLTPILKSMKQWGDAHEGSQRNAG